MLELPIITHEYIIRGFGEPTDLDFSLAEYVLRAMKANNKRNLIEADTGNSISNTTLIKQIMSLAECLKEKGVKPDDVVGICSENRLEFLVPVLATLALGATVSTMNPLYTPDELKHVISIAKPIIVFCSPYTARNVKAVQPTFPFLRELVLFDFGGPCDTFTRYTELIRRPVDPDHFHCAKVNPRESVAVILCSSGTTGLPKCVELTHTNILCFFNVARYSPFFTEGENASDVVTLGLVPFYHGYGFALLLSSAAMNMKIIVMSRFDEEKFLSNIEKYKVTSLCIVPPIAVFLAKHPLVEKYDLSSLRNVICGAAPLSKEVQFAVQKRLKLKSDMRQGYGMTEVSLATLVTPSQKSRIGSVGIPVPGVECKVIDMETGKALPPLKEGEICFRGPFLMKGYKNNPAATSEAVDSEGWLHTGDVGYYDPEGFMFIVDRLKELIKYKGFQVAPAELEALLLTNPKIKDAGVVGLPDEETGELPIAFVVKQAGAQITEAEITRFVAEKVSPQKRLNMVIFVDEIPKNPSGKILRRELRKMMQAKLKQSKL